MKNLNKEAGKKKIKTLCRSVDNKNVHLLRNSVMTIWR